MERGIQWKREKEAQEIEREETLEKESDLKTERILFRKIKKENLYRERERGPRKNKGEREKDKE